MGGNGRIQFVDGLGTHHAQTIAIRAANEAVRIEKKYSRFDGASLVSRINRSAGRLFVPIDQETRTLLDRCHELYQLTEGAFDPTAGVLNQVWDFRSGRVPTPEALRELLPSVGFEKVRVDARGIFPEQVGMEIDFGGVGKEYAVDRVGEVLRGGGVRCGIVNLAGDLCTVGARSDGRPWKIGITDPVHPEQTRFSVRLLGDAGVASSGDYERGFERNGVRYHHILDARTGLPARGLRSVTVIARRAFTAGLAASAAFLLGPHRGLTYLEQSDRIEGVIIDEAGELRATTGMARCSDLPGALFSQDSCPFD